MWAADRTAHLKAGTLCLVFCCFLFRAWASNKLILTPDHSIYFYLL